MLGMGFSRALTESGFQHRATAVGGGRVVYRLADGSGHVALDADEWDALGEHFRAEARPVGRTTTWLSIGLFPAVFVFGMTIGQILPGAGILILAGILLGPLAIYLWQSYRIKHIARAIEKELARLPRAVAPPAPPGRPPRWLEIACILLVGPGLIVQVYGSFNPTAFRNTPWTGMHLGWGGIAGFAVLGAMLFYRWRAARDAPPGVPDQEREGRRSDVIMRARGGGP
ncbi:MAG TPA: hypothetical protein VK614_00795 [Allosphingosinicella sp.]|nr:hypothetical protein [Allosphingosinicella sp.]